MHARCADFHYKLLSKMQYLQFTWCVNVKVYCESLWKSIKASQVKHTSVTWAVVDQMLPAQLKLHKESNKFNPEADSIKQDAVAKYWSIEKNSYSFIKMLPLLKNLFINLLEDSSCFPALMQRCSACLDDSLSHGCGGLFAHSSFRCCFTSFRFAFF